jgi:hypothetical protein
MKVGLAFQYRLWMCLLLPSTLGVGTARLWARSLNWPCSIDSEALTLRSRRQVRWEAIRTIAVRRDYVDGHVSRIDIHYPGGSCEIPVHALRDGESIAATILAMFKAARHARPPKSLVSAGVEARDTPKPLRSNLELNAAPTLVPKPTTARHYSSNLMSIRNGHGLRTHTAA